MVNLRFCSFIFILSLVFSSCNNEGNSSENTNAITGVDSSYFYDLAPKLAYEVFTALNQQLEFKIQSEGIQGALNYCNVNALRLTDSISTLHDVVISRIAQKNRNPNNKLTSREDSIFNAFEMQRSYNKKTEPFFDSFNKESLVWYAPIYISNVGCLKCHGKPGIDILEEDFVQIQMLYPEDKALDFSLGSLRGLWKIEFQNFALNQYK